MLQYQLIPREVMNISLIFSEAGDLVRCNPVILPSCELIFY